MGSGKSFRWNMESVANNEKEESSDEEFDEIVDDETELDDTKSGLETSLASANNTISKPELSHSSQKSDNMQPSEQRPTFGVGTIRRAEWSPPAGATNARHINVVVTRRHIRGWRCTAVWWPAYTAAWYGTSHTL